MIKNAFAPNGPHSRSDSAANPVEVVSNTFAGEREVVHNQLTDHLQSLGHEAEHIGEKLGLTHHGDSKGPHAATGGNGNQPRPTTERNASSSDQPQGNGPKSSDDEPETSESPAIVVEEENEDERSRSHTRGVRSQVRDRLFGRQRAGTERQHGHARAGSAGGTTRDPAARLRAGSVRDPRRDASPARSIRFADDRPGSSGAGTGAGEDSNGAGTPASLMTPTSGGAESGSANETPGSRVMFDLPAQRPR